MLEKSIPLEQSIEIIQTENISPLISKCQIKVCYVGNEPNRNGSVITKETARQMAPSLRGCPIVGHYNRENKDFEQHNVRLTLDEESSIIKVESDTVPYGFVDLNANIWFEKFEEQGVQREYLMTEGFIWATQFPDAKRILEKGNNQSMELDENSLKGSWTKMENGEISFFVISEANISKLCVLGENVEPCFEGAQIKTSFSFAGEFFNKLYSMAEELQEILKEGGDGTVDDMNTNVVIEGEEGNPISPDAEPVVTPEEPDEFKKAEDEEKEDEKASEEEEKEPESKDEDEKKKKDEDGEDYKCKEEKKYSVTEDPAYIELSTKYSDLETRYNELTNSFNSLKEETESLRSFKKEIELDKKKDMIDSFYMLSDEDKKDVLTNIETYSLDDIEAKLSIICVRNKVNFNLDKDPEDGKIVTYNLEDQNVDNAPDWIKAIRETAKSMH